MNDRWQMIALHNMAVADRNESGDYLDADGNPIPGVQDQRTDPRVRYVANQGIRVSSIVGSLEAQELGETMTSIRDELLTMWEDAFWSA